MNALSNHCTGNKAFFCICCLYVYLCNCVFAYLCICICVYLSISVFVQLLRTLPWGGWPLGTGLWLLLAKEGLVSRGSRAFHFFWFNFFLFSIFLKLFPWNLLLMKYLRTRSSSSLATLSVARLFRSLFFLAWQQKLEKFLHFSHQVLVELLKVAGDDGDGEGHDQHPADGTHAPNKLDSTKILFHFVIISIEMLVQRCF